ncbi:galactosyl transferase [Bradyrhizobium lablabi]|uniref:galactosyl transferase n=1 Tax=Bradyrhizobium lablabi TaxID=722472 RepID=UPI001BA818F2|nr:galactosyl transferase [Bradyrhizobium lablabi]MBR0697928.1 galactosyl transferase [Bradyrhizobium lablabi]
MLTFIIPVRHPANSKNWDALKARLAQTVTSISGQNSDRWQAIIVANVGADLPALPKGFSVERVDFPPNPKYERGVADDVEVFWDFVRIDKGRRVRAGMLAARNATFFMIVDDDDFVSSKLADYVAEHPDENGWYIDRGYLWSEGNLVLGAISKFFMLCGTSHIINARLYDLERLRENDADDYMKRTLGSHISVAHDLAAAGTPLSPLPFFGAIYRVGHAGAHSRSSRLIATFFSKATLVHPIRFVKTALSLRLLTPKLRREFFGAGPA